MANEKLKDLLRPFVAGGIGGDGEQRLRCPNPEHNDRQASASVNWEMGVWHCMGCNASGTLRQLSSLVRKASKAALNGNGHKAEVIDLGTRRKHKAGQTIEVISESQIRGYVKFLREEPRLLTYLTDERGLSIDALDEWEIGYDARRRRYTIPVRDEIGRLVNIRRYSRTATPKMKNAAGHGDPPRLYPQDNLNSDRVVLCEGEWDALVSTQHGFQAVTGTHGSGTWEPSWTRQFKDKKVYICYDNDEEGRLGALRASKALRSVAQTVAIVRLPVENEHEDLSDWWTSYGGRADDFQELMESASVDEADRQQDNELDTGAPTPVEVQVIGSMDSTTNGKPLVMTTTITGKKNPTYSVPHLVSLSCSLDAGPKCKSCPMNLIHEGEAKLVIAPTDVANIARLIDQPDTKILTILREMVGAPKCSRFSFDDHKSVNQTVEELFVTGNIDTRSDGDTADYTQRRIYNVGNHDTMTNMVANVIGTTVPSPKDRRNEFFSWDLTESITSIDAFKVTDEVVERLSIFQPSTGQSPIDKCMEISKDLGDNVTGITGRERLHVAMDLVWHSLLHFPLDDKDITRGWLEFLVVGDTRTGKSETAHRLAKHYGLGHVIGCESATFAGLVGAVKQVSETWVINWGEITINDRRLVILDEASGLSQDIIGQLSDIRSRGVAQLTKAESQLTRARCRMIWISNPRRPKFQDVARIEGIDVIEDLIGNPEDIARFDLAMSVSASDVDNKQINQPHREKVPHVFSADVCRELVLWAWSRRSSDVQWNPDAYEAVYRAAEWMGQRYVDTPPLVQRTNVREKIARIAVALAARTFSTSDGHNVIVSIAHVKDATNFMDRLYGYENFGYRRLSERVKDNRKTARKNAKRVRRWLSENPKLLEFLLGRRSSFRAQDLAEMTNSDSSYVNYVLGKLSDAKMVDKQMAQIVVSPELHSILRDIEKERHGKD